MFHLQQSKQGICHAIHFFLLFLLIFKNNNKVLTSISWLNRGKEMQVVWYVFSTPVAAWKHKCKMPHAEWEFVPSSSLFGLFAWTSFYCTPQLPSHKTRDGIVLVKASICPCLWFFFFFLFLPLCNIKMNAGVCTSLLSVSFGEKECVLLHSWETSRWCKTGKSKGERKERLIRQANKVKMPESKQC